MTALEILSILVATAAVFGWITSRWLKLPITIGTMALTVLAALALGVAGSFAPGIHGWAVELVRQIDFESLILHGMLPLLLFAAAFLLDIDELSRQKLAVSILAIPGTVLCFLLVSVLMHFASGGRADWIECLLFGALLSPTDPIAVIEMLRRTGVPKPIEAQLAGESLFNDGIGAVLFITMLEVARGHAPTPWQVAALLIVKAGGATLLGVVAAWLASQLMRRVESYQVEVLLTLTLALGGYVIAEQLRLSAPLEAVIAGIALRFFNKGLPQGSIAYKSIDAFWEVIDEVQNAVLFVLLGLEAIVITLDASSLRAGLAAILAVNTVRLAVVFLLFGVLRMIRPGTPGSRSILCWGGLRGGLSIALALSVPEALGRSWMLGATYLVVVFSIVIQGGSMEALIRWRNRRISVS